MKKLTALLLVLIFLAGCGANKVIGTISGAENEYITINGVIYELDTENDFSAENRGKYLGDVTGSVTMQVYSVEGDDTGDYIYALWEWEGSFYVRQKGLNEDH